MTENFNRYLSQSNAQLFVLLNPGRICQLGQVTVTFGNCKKTLLRTLTVAITFLALQKINILKCTISFLNFKMLLANKDLFQVVKMRVHLIVKFK